MITEWIFDRFRAGVDLVLGWLPESAAPDYSEQVAGLTGLWQYAGWLNRYVPLAEAALLGAALMSVWMAITVFRLTVWVLSKAHLLGGSSD